MQAPYLFPENRVNLVKAGSRGDNHGLLGRVDINPPGGQVGSKEALAQAVSGLPGSPPVVHDRLGYLTLLRPQMHASAFLGPGNRVISKVPGGKQASGSGEKIQIAQGL